MYVLNLLQHRKYIYARNIVIKSIYNTQHAIASIFLRIVLLGIYQLRVKTKITYVLCYMYMLRVKLFSSANDCIRVDTRTGVCLEINLNQRRRTTHGGLFF